MAHDPKSTHAGALLTLQRIEPYEHMGIALASDVLDADGRIRDLYSAYHDDLVPGLNWSAVLAAQSFVLVVEDPDAPGDKPFVHWLLWNIPGTATAIPAGLSRVTHPPELPGAIQGKNSGGTFGWHGAQPPPGHGVHHYHFQLFALSQPLEAPPSTSLEELVTTLKGLAIAKGELVGTYERLDPAADAPSPGRTGGYGEAPYADSEREKSAGRGGLDSDDLDRHAPHDPDGVTRR